MKILKIFLIFTILVVIFCGRGTFNALCSGGGRGSAPRLHGSERNFSSARDFGLFLHNMAYAMDTFDSGFVFYETRFLAPNLNVPLGTDEPESLKP